MEKLLARNGMSWLRAVSVIFTEACIEAPQHAPIEFRLVVGIESFGRLAIVSVASSDTRKVSHISSTSAHGGYIDVGHLRQRRSAGLCR